jgi:phosphoglycerate dehydrogenase-like enzyme
LNRLLSEYDDGRKDVFFCLAVNLMELDDLYAVLAEADSVTIEMPLSEKAAIMKQMLIDAAKKKNITLELRR